jgi:hypothetical protein
MPRLTALGLMAGTVGNYALALQALDEACTLLNDSGQLAWRHSAENYHAFVWIFLGQYARAQQVIADFDAVREATMAARRIALRGRITRLLGGNGQGEFERALQSLPAGPASTGVRLATELDLARCEPPQEALARCRRVEAQAIELTYPAYALHARLLAIPRLPDTRQAAAAAQRALDDLRSMQPADQYLPEGWWLCHQALEAAGLAEEAAAALHAAVRWIQDKALPTVPEPFRDSFLHRNPVNALVLAKARSITNR